MMHGQPNIKKCSQVSRTYCHQRSYMLLIHYQQLPLIFTNVLSSHNDTPSIRHQQSHYSPLLNPEIACL